ncbi:MULTISPECIES: ParB/RepB/Spo0J family partition protein [unclassified Paracoccus (in: a-proteobacteria)]|uniref:ParB/RepB/Spo0J family partition protein n=1 Tax=unclassified Paracoccus (in: a-proteobacteria) TaxID=2688777 RepID=UPI0012B43FCD|nr:MULTISPECIES: ParB N-terminal domain-containing protein [unclassified Paracoccus (in: a-proteobacteria)]UXU76624.1 ParB N-terminal domain-containing protein [Paracoccus sp. SMMA_5]UXU82512.1 ParB N-terminal domain-containing protein [Paracoccus sp. SMMA_5_TC]
MAKRRRLETPSSADLDRIEAQFRNETSDRPPLARTVAPIAQIAADTAATLAAESADSRAERARLQAEAQRLHQAEAEGLLIRELPLDSIDDSVMVRDRLALGEEEMLELRLSIAAHGLRLPIEVFEMPATDGQGPRYGLISGYRRLHAVRALHELTGAEKHAAIRALIRPRADSDAAFVAMVEENEVREELSLFERGRIAVIAAQQGAFLNTEEAVNKLFATGSKAKRSKLRSFALIFEELGDMLRFPEALSERRGLRLASALRAGAEARLRRALSVRMPEDAEEEWALIEPVLQASEAAPRDPSRGGRPRNAAPAPGWVDEQTLRTSAGITLRRGRDSRGFVLHLSGPGLSEDLMDSLMVEIQSLLER